MGRSFYIITGLIGFLTGVGLYLVWQPNIVLIFSFLVLIVGCLFALSFYQRRRGNVSALSGSCGWRGYGTALLGEGRWCHYLTALSRERLWFRYVTALLVFLMFVFLGLGRGILAEHRVNPNQVDYYNEQKVELVGVITEVDIRRDKAKYTISVEVPIEGPIVVKGDVLITLDKYPQYHYGDRVKIYGELQEPGEFNGFSYGNYLSRYGVYSVMYYPYIDVLEEGQGNLFWSGMMWMQTRFMNAINQLFPEPHASFEAGLLVGARKGIPDSLMEKFNITGLTHIIAISGYNITIIIVFVMWMLKGLPRRVGFGIAVGSIVLFTLFVGASPAVVRASIMGILGLIALNYGRQTNISLTILWTAFFMVLWNPKILWWDVGFQLSFSAVLGLIYVAPLFEKYSKKLPEAFGVREAIMMTLSAQVMALPIIIFNFERLSLIAPIANLLVIFAIPPAMLFGFMAVLLSFFSHILGLIPAYIAWGILSYIIKIIEITADIPYASVNLPGMKVWMMFFYYILLGLVLVVAYRRKDSGIRIQDSGIRIQDSAGIDI